MKKIAFVSNTAYSLYLFRLGVMRRLHKEGWKISCIAPSGPRMEELKAEGFEFVDLKVERKGINPFNDFLFLLRILKLYRRGKYSIIFHYTIKFHIYGSFAAKLAGAVSVAVISGLGYTFTQNNWLTKIVRLLYRFALFFPEKIFFLNEDDQTLFIKDKLVQPDKTLVLPSEGVNTGFYAPIKLQRTTEKPFVFLFAGRFLWDKGIGELIEAFKLIKKNHPQTELWLLGMVDKGNPRGISESAINLWELNGMVKYLRQTSDVRTFIAQCNTAIYPSYYREGVPRFLLEAMSMEKPIITTNSVGCKEVIEDGKNGIMVEPRSASLLAEAMESIIELSEEERIVMGKRGREKAIHEFAEEKIISIYLGIINEIAS